MILLLESLVYFAVAAGFTVYVCRVIPYRWALLPAAIGVFYFASALIKSHLIWGWSLDGPSSLLELPTPYVPNVAAAAGGFSAGLIMFFVGRRRSAGRSEVDSRKLDSNV